MENLSEKNIYGEEVAKEREERFATENANKEKQKELRTNIKNVYAQANKELQKGTLPDGKFNALTEVEFPKEYKDKILSGLNEFDKKEFEKKDEQSQGSFLMEELAKNEDDWQTYEALLHQSSGLRNAKEELEEKKKQDWALQNLSRHMPNNNAERIGKLSSEELVAFRKTMDSGDYEDAMKAERNKE